MWKRLGEIFGDARIWVVLAAGLLVTALVLGALSSVTTLRDLGMLALIGLGLAVVCCLFAWLGMLGPAQKPVRGRQDTDKFQKGLDEARARERQHRPGA